MTKEQAERMEKFATQAKIIPIEGDTQHVRARIGNSFCIYKMEVVCKRSDGDLVLKHTDPFYDKGQTYLVHCSEGTDWVKYEVLDPAKRRVIDF